MTDRRYDETEIAAIFRAAAEDPQGAQRRVPHDQGMTLAELQAIGREVGIPEDAVARAALTLDVRAAAATRKILGLPLGVSRSVNLNRRLSDEEWERVVVQLREVFSARGTTRSDGSLRQWTNGNLQVLLEPTETGHRLRLATLHGAARASIGAGVGALIAGTTMTIATALAGSVMDVIPAIVLFYGAGVGMIANGALRLPAWARLRGRQMEAIAARVAASGTTAGERPPSSLPSE
jgi:hypothetical protein